MRNFRSHSGISQKLGMSKAVYSHSKLSTYENCPQQFKLKYIDRIEPPEGKEGIEAFLGSRVHETLEKLYKELILTKLNTLDDLLQYYSSQWDKNWNEDTIEIVKKEFTKDHYRNAGVQAITEYYNRLYPFNQSKTVATEYLITFTVGDYTIRGYIDRLSFRDKGVYEIHDYKTSGTLPPQERLDKDRQLALYQIGIREKFSDAEDVRLIWHYLLFDREITSARTDAQLEDLKGEVISLIKTIERDTIFTPVESILCDWCEYIEYCPAKKHEIKVQDLPPNKYLQDDGVTLVNRYASIKTKIKELRDEEKTLQMELDLLSDAAAEYAKREGVTNITGSDNILKITEERVYQFPRSDDEGREELEEFIKEAGIWNDVSGLNLTRLTKILEDEDLDNKIREGLLKFAEEVYKVDVRLVKKREPEK